TSRRGGQHRMSSPRPASTGGAERRGAGRIQNQWEAQHQRRAVSELRCHLQGAPVGEVQQHYRVSAVSERVPIGYAKAAKRVKNTVTPTSVQVSTDLNCGRSVASVTTSYIGKMRPMPSNVYMAIPRPQFMPRPRSRLCMRTHWSCRLHHTRVDTLTRVLQIQQGHGNSFSKRARTMPEQKAMGTFSTLRPVPWPVQSTFVLTPRAHIQSARPRACKV
ncbi:unnamed protein product, partial [Prorocentrum cordatum]